MKTSLENFWGCVYHHFENDYHFHFVDKGSFLVNIVQRPQTISFMRQAKVLQFTGKNPIALDEIESLSPPVTEQEVDRFSENYSDNTPISLTYAGDNYGPADPLFLKAMTLALSVPTLTYQTGGKILNHAQDVFHHEFTGDDHYAPVVTLFTPTGTAANRIGLSPVLRSIDAILAADNSHLATREAGAYHRMNNGSVYSLKTENGKLSYEATKEFLEEFDRRGDWSYAGKAKPKVISISQPAEYGAMYTDEEVKAFAELAHERGMLLQMDGARLFYVSAKTGKSLKELTTDLGVDIVFLGGSKNKMAMAESVVYTPNFFQNASHYAKNDTPEDLFRELRSYAKQAGISIGQSAPAAAQFTYALEKQHATHLAKRAIASAKKLEDVLLGIPGASLLMPTETNVVLMSLPISILQKLQEKYKLMVFPTEDSAHPGNKVVRFMTSASTRQEDINSLQAEITAITKAD